MSWEHDLAKSINSVPPPSLSAGWYRGTVVSPIRTFDPETGDPVYTGPLIISAFRGELTFEGDRLFRLSGGLPLYNGLTVALMGDVFSKGVGAQNVLVLGVVESAV